MMHMDEHHIRDLQDWLIGEGLYGLSEPDLLNGFCERCREAGFAVSDGLVLVDTLHPTFEGRAYRWRDDGATTIVEYGRTQAGQAAANWQRSPFYHLLQTGGSELRCSLDGSIDEFANLPSLRADGHRDYVAFVHRFATDSAIGELDSIFSHWTTRVDEGFTEAELVALRRLVPALALAMKAAALTRVPITLAETYLGRDPARRVISGRIVRGVADRLTAALWFSDLRGYTSLTESIEPDAIIPLLNDYADAVISAIHANGGDVLKFIGDAVLAIFPAGEPARAARAALYAERELRGRVAALKARRRAAGEPVSAISVALHFGEVLYGNIGSEDRLDFTVVGPAVNEVSRISSMCRSVDRMLLTSTDFHDALDEASRRDLVSVGRFALRGVGRAQDLYTFDPALPSVPPAG
jgi:adenylate cyclase